MEVQFTNKFSRQLDKIKDRKLLDSVSEKVREVIQADDLSQITHLRKLKGYKQFYRIRIGDYRIGLKIENKTFIFSTIAHRKDIYKNFP
jgi:mRNA interferase RelE/StbE